MGRSNSPDEVLSPRSAADLNSRDSAGRAPPAMKPSTRPVSPGPSLLKRPPTPGDGAVGGGPLGGKDLTWRRLF